MINRAFVEIVALILISLSIILLIVSEQSIRLNKKKGAFAFILSLIFTGISCYYLYLVFYNKPASSILKKELYFKQPIMKETKSAKKSENKAIEKKVKTSQGAVFVYIKVNGETLKVASGDEVEMHKNTKFKILKVETKPLMKNVKANFIGFVPSGKNTGQDIGYWISYKNLRKDKSLDRAKTKYQLTIKSGKKIIGKIYFKFVK